MYVCACLFMYVYAYMFVCTCGCLACIYNYLYVLVACHSILDLFGEIRTSCRRPGPDPNYVVVDPTHRRFEDRCIG